MKNFHLSTPFFCRQPYNYPLRMAKLVMLIICFQGTLRAQDKLYPNTFPLRQVKLTTGVFSKARDLNIKTLLAYDVDRMLAPYRKQAGLAVKKDSYKNWEGLDGHIAGHYLTAMALNYAATGNAECKRRMDYMVAELAACQQKNTAEQPGWAKGYAGGVPGSAKIWTGVKAGDFKAYNSAWVPWYNVHKMYAGLRDAWAYGGNRDARIIFLNFCDWSIDITHALSDKQMEAMLDMEHGGMNEILADAYQMTGDDKYLDAAKRFSHHQLLDPMAAGKDNLDNKHANTQVPKAIGFQRIGELSHEPAFDKSGHFFWETVTNNRTLAFGGNSRREFFPGVAACVDFVNDVEGPESCNTYNMLKLTQGLFREAPLAKYADFYERALYNHILSTQHPVHGGYVYFTPARPRHYRVYSAPNEAMWCCVGSGMENHGKYNEFIYTHVGDSLYLNLFIPSELDWTQKGIKIKQETKFPDEEQTRFSITQGAANFTLMLRHPAWVKKGTMQIMVNGKTIKYDTSGPSYIAIHRKWKKGDVVTVLLPMQTTIEHMPNVPEYVAIMRGPILLAAKTASAQLNGIVADDSRWGHIASGEKLPVSQAPIIIEEAPQSIPSHIKPVPGQPMNFSFKDEKLANAEKLVLEPFYRIHDARYMMYWMTLSPSEYNKYLDSVTQLEAGKLALEKRTVDFVAPGEQQPEADHVMQSENSRSGAFADEFWRSAVNGGYFSYKMSTGGSDDLSLHIRLYAKANTTGEEMEIYIDDQLLTPVDAAQTKNKSGFYNETYPIPDRLLKGHTNIVVKFRALPEKSTMPVYYIRLLKGAEHKDN